MNARPRAVSNAAGFCENETSRMFFAAESPPSRPGLSLLRGSSLLGYVCAARTEGTIRGAMSANALREKCIGKSSGLGRGFLLVGQLGQHLAHGADLCGLHGDDVV